MATNPPRAIGSYLVTLDGSEASYNALAVACETARHTKAKVLGIYVIEVPRSQPIDADLQLELQRGEEILERAEAVAREHHVEIEADLLQARQAGHAIVDEAIERGADAIVVGLEYHRPYGRFELGEVPDYVLEHAPGEVWLIRYPPPKDGDSNARPDAAR